MRFCDVDQWSQDTHTVELSEMEMERTRIVDYQNIAQCIFRRYPEGQEARKLMIERDLFKDTERFSCFVGVRLP